MAGGTLICAVCLRGLGGACDFRFVAGVIGYAAEVLRDEAPAEQQTHARGERGTPLLGDIFHVRQLAAAVRFRDIFFLYTAEGLEQIDTCHTVPAFL